MDSVCIYIYIYIYMYVYICMYVYVYAVILCYCVHHSKIFWSIYRKLVWVGFESKTTEFLLDTLTDWAIRQTQRQTRLLSVRLNNSAIAFLSHDVFCFFYSTWGNHMSVCVCVCMWVCGVCVSIYIYIYI